MPKILFISSLIYPVDDSESIVNANLVKALLDYNWEVSIITAYKSRNRDMTGDGFESVKNSIYSLYTIGKYGNISRLFANFKAYKSGIRLLRDRKIDCIFCRMPPSALPGWLISRKTGVPFIINWNDPWPWNKFPPPYAAGPSACLKWFEAQYIRKIAANAKCHTFPSKRLMEYMMGYFNYEDATNCRVIPHAAPEKRKYRYVQSDKLHICYAGIVVPYREKSFFVFLEGLEMFLNERPGANIKISFVGEKRENFSAEQKKKIEKVPLEFCGIMPYHQTLEYSGTADVQLIIEAPCEDGIFLPTKLVDYSSTGRPIFAVSPKNGVIADFMAELPETGYIADCRNPMAIKLVIERIYEDWRSGKIMAKNSWGLYEKFSHKTIAGSYKEMLESLMII